MKKLILIALVSAGLIAARPAFACCDPAEHKGPTKAAAEKQDLKEKFFHKVHMLLMHKDKLGLSEDQYNQIKDIKVQLKKSKILKDAEIETLKLDIMMALKKDPVDVKAANKLIEKKYAVKTQMAKDVVQAYANVKQVLSDDQKAMMKDMMSHGLCPHCGKADCGGKKECSGMKMKGGLKICPITGKPLQSSAR